MSSKIISEERVQDGIDKITLESGTVRYRVKPGNLYDGDGRHRPARRCKNLTEARKRLKEMQRNAATGVAIPSQRKARNVADAIQGYLNSIQPTVSTGTMRDYRDRLYAIGEEFGPTPVHELEADHLTAFVNKVMAVGYQPRQKGRKPKPWRARTVNFTLGQLWSVMEREVLTRKVPFNVVNPKITRRIPSDTKTARTYTTEQLETFCAGCEGDRYYVAYRLAFSGLCLEEICGLRWEHVDLRGGEMTISEGRVIAEVEQSDGTYKCVEEITNLKNKYRSRTLEIPAPTLKELERTHTRQLRERVAAGPYWIADGDYVVTMESGKRVDPATLRKAFYRRQDAVNLPRITPHEARSTCATLLALDGVHSIVIAAWLGHRDSSIAEQVYITKQPGATKGVSKMPSLSIAG